MDRKKSRVGFALALWLASGIPALAVTKATQKVYAEPQADQALVYFIREPHFQGSARTMFLYADETFLGVVDNNSYTFAQVEPGKRLFWLNWAKINDEVELEAGKTYYFSVWSRFTELDEESAKRLIEATKFYTTPEAKEEQTSQQHISKRYAKAERYAAKPKKEYVGTESKREEHVAKWPRVDLSPYSILYVEDFAMTDPKADARKKEALVETVPRRLADLVVKVLGEETFAEVHRSAPEQSGDGALILRAEITQYKPGSDTARLMLAGAGSAHLDFTVHLVDAATGEDVTTFSGERTWAWGGAVGASRGIEDIEQNVAYEIALYLQQRKGVQE